MIMSNVVVQQLFHKMKRLAHCYTVTMTAIYHGVIN